MRMLLDAIRTLGCSTLCLWVVSFLASPASAAVESDVVGYTTITTNPGFNMQGVVFVGLEDASAISPNDLLSGEFQTGDTIQVFKDGSYSSCRFEEGTGWVQGRGAPANPIEVGSGFWLETPNRAVEVTFKGAVTTGDFRYQTIEGVQMVAPNIPIAFPLNPTNGEVQWEGFQDGDMIQWFEGESYASSVYSTEKGGWTQGRGQLTTKEIPVGSSVWLTTARAGASFTIRNPLSK